MRYNFWVCIKLLALILMTVFLAVAFIFPKLLSEVIETPVGPISLFNGFLVLLFIFYFLIIYIWIRGKVRLTTYGLIFVVVMAALALIAQELAYHLLLPFLIILSIILVLLTVAGKLYVSG